MSKDQDALAQGMQEGMAQKCGVGENKTEEAKCVEEAMLSLMRVRMQRNEANERILKLEAERNRYRMALKLVGETGNIKEAHRVVNAAL